MKAISGSKRLTVSFTLLTLVLSGCATNPDGSFKKGADGNYVIDAKAKGALIGAGTGCVAAIATGHDCIAGAVVGAVVGFFVSWYFESKKIATAEEVNKEYMKKGHKIDKHEIKPVAFKSDIKKSPPAANGETEVQVTASTDLVGYGEKVPELKQQYAIYDNNNKLVETKTEKVASVDGAGRFETTSKFKVPASAKGQKYRVETTLLANDKAYKTNKFQVSFFDNGSFRIASIH
jgi:hypothetical protein